MIKKEEKIIIRVPSNPIKSSLTKSIIPQQLIAKKTDKSEQAINLSTNNITKPKTLIGGAKLANVKTSSSTGKKDASLKPENVNKLVTLNIKLESTRELKSKIKEIEDIKKLNANKINLTLSTVFSSDSELSAFTQSLEKVITNVRNLKWVIKGRLKDTGQGWTIGNVIKKCKSLYSLVLELNFPFLDQSASELASCIQKHKDLKILKLRITDKDLLLEQQSSFTEVGNTKINNAIAQLQNLQILEYNGLNYYGNQQLRIIHNLTFLISLEELEERTLNPVGSNHKSLAEILVKRENRITSLKFTNRSFYIRFKEIHYGCCCCEEDDDEAGISIAQFQFTIQMLLQLVLQLPYLTSFTVSYYIANDYDQYPELYPEEKQTKKLLTVKELIQQRFFAVTSFILLAKQAFQEIPLNPYVLFSDLYFD